MEREYFEAKFEGLKDLMLYQHANTSEHIQAVSKNVREVAADLRAHQESIDPHGRRATDKFSANAIAWLSLALASLVAAFEIRKH